MTDIQTYLTKQEYLDSANHLKQSKSTDFCLGFDTGVQWLANYVKELLGTECPSQLPKSDVE